jgi:NAD-dependent dihydropyrimidine dehydrogenase PreA subunit
MTYVITEPCIGVKDRTCVDECPVECSYERQRMLYIRRGECVDCGACEPVRPVEAIFYEDDVPERWAQFTIENVRFFGQLGSPGGAFKTGALPYDTDYVASYVTSR